MNFHIDYEKKAIMGEVIVQVFSFINPDRSLNQLIPNLIANIRTDTNTNMKIHTKSAPFFYRNIRKYMAW